MYVPCLSDDDKRSLTGLDIETVSGDVTDPVSLRFTFAGAERVFHLAGIVTIMPCMASVLGRVNVGGMRNVIAGSMEAIYAAIIGLTSVGDLIFEYMLPTLFGNILSSVILVAVLNNAPATFGRRK